MSNFENEVKIYVTNLDEVEQKLQSNGAQLVQARVYERNVRYDLDDKSLSSRGVVV